MSPLKSKLTNPEICSEKSSNMFRWQYHMQIATASSPNAGGKSWNEQRRPTEVTKRAAMIHRLIHLRCPCGARTVTQQQTQVCRNVICPFLSGLAQLPRKESLTLHWFFRLKSLRDTEILHKMKKFTSVTNLSMQTFLKHAQTA